MTTSAEFLPASSHTMRSPLWYALPATSAAATLLATGGAYLAIQQAGTISATLATYSIAPLWVYLSIVIVGVIVTTVFLGTLPSSTKSMPSAPNIVWRCPLPLRMVNEQIYGLGGNCGITSLWTIAMNIPSLRELVLSNQSHPTAQRLAQEYQRRQQQQDLNDFSVKELGTQGSFLMQLIGGDNLGPDSPHVQCIGDRVQELSSKTAQVVFLTSQKNPFPLLEVPSSVEANTAYHLKGMRVFYRLHRSGGQHYYAYLVDHSAHPPSCLRCDDINERTRQVSPTRMNQELTQLMQQADVSIECFYEKVRA